MVLQKSCGNQHSFYLDRFLRGRTLCPPSKHKKLPAFQALHSLSSRFFTHPKGCRTRNSGRLATLRLRPIKSMLRMLLYIGAAISCIHSMNFGQRKRDLGNQVPLPASDPITLPGRARVLPVRLYLTCPCRVGRHRTRTRCPPRKHRIPTALRSLHSSYRPPEHALNNTVRHPAHRTTLEQSRYPALTCR